jgi:hypothetical protein
MVNFEYFSNIVYNVFIVKKRSNKKLFNLKFDFLKLIFHSKNKNNTRFVKTNIAKTS